MLTNIAQAKMANCRHATNTQRREIVVTIMLKPKLTLAMKENINSGFHARPQVHIERTNTVVGRRFLEIVKSTADFHDPTSVESR